MASYRLSRSRAKLRYFARAQTGVSCRGGSARQVVRRRRRNLGAHAGRIRGAHDLAQYLSYCCGGKYVDERRLLAMSRVSQNWYQQEIPLLGVIERHFLHRRIDIAIGNSQAVLNELRAEGIPDQKLLLIHNGIDARNFADQMLDRKTARDQLAIPQDALVFTCVGNLYLRKGRADLLTALHLLKDQLPADWLLLTAGRDVDDNLGKLRQTANELGLSQHVRLVGERHDIPVILSAADHVSPSWYESFPNNILEAMSAGVPVAATAVGGVPEQIVDDLTGILVPARTPHALAEAIITLARDADRRKAMGRAGRKRVVRSVSALEQAYEHLRGRCTSLERNPARAKPSCGAGL
jgi:glycosyltransferase involved in cell wall biosynthesis